MKTLKISRTEDVEEHRIGGPPTVPEETTAPSPAPENAAPRKSDRALENSKATRRLRRTPGQTNGHSLPAVENVPLFVRTVAAWRGLGYSLREISAQCGVTPQALSVMLVRQRESLLAASSRPNELAGLSPRAVNSLGSLGISTKAAARRLHDLEARLRAQRNCGHKTRREIFDWIASHREE